jgi:hypothetical protein
LYYILRFTCLTFMLATPLWAAAPAEENVDNPAYQAWSKFNPGTSVTQQTETTLRGAVTVMEMTQRLIEVSPEKITLESTMKYQQTVRTQKREIAAKVKKAEARAAEDMPAGVIGEMKALPDERIVVGEKALDCKVVAFTGKDKGQDVSGTIWTSSSMPGRLVKSETHSQGPTEITNKSTTTAIDVR